MTIQVYGIAWAILGARNPSDFGPLQPVPIFSDKGTARTVARTQTGGCIVEVRLRVEENVYPFDGRGDSPHFLHDGSGIGNHTYTLHERWEIEPGQLHTELEVFPFPKGAWK